MADLALHREVGAYQPKTGLIRYEAARHALQECVRVDEAKNILDKVEALRVYAHQQQDTEMEFWLCEMKLRARRKIGEISKSLETIKPQDSGAMAHSGSTTAGTTSKKAALEEAGLSKNVANRCEHIADIPEEEFESVIDAAKDKGKPVTYSDVESAVKKKRNQNERKQKEADEAKKSQKYSGIKARVLVGDCLDIINDIAPVDLLIADPPYFTDGDFTVHISACLRRVKRNGQAYVFTGANPIEVAAYLAMDSGHMELVQLLVWNYNNTGQRQPNERYTSNYQLVLYYRGPDAPQINKPADGKEQYACQTINAPDARIDYRYHKWQKPLDLIKRLIRNSSDESGFVFDPFVGSGTTVLAACSLGREAFGCDTDQAAIQICVERGCVVEV